MNCLSCAQLGSERTAVALCPQCQAGLCLGHVRETARDQGPGGMNLSCGHQTWDSAWQQARVSGPQESFIAPDRTVTT
ncbi:MAG TPA: DUF2180 family protein [Streptosporangiaceae bacterium]|jgi:hypothetical protein